MHELGLVEVLRHTKGQLTPTFRNANNREVIHQLDHLFISKQMIPNLLHCDVGSADEVFGGNLSDHLPIIADFKNLDAG